MHGLGGCSGEDGAMDIRCSFAAIGQAPGKIRILASPASGGLVCICTPYMAAIRCDDGAHREETRGDTKWLIPVDTHTYVCRLVRAPCTSKSGNGSMLLFGGSPTVENGKCDD